MTFPWNEKILEMRLRFTFSEAILFWRRYRLISLIFLFLDLVWNSVIYDIALPCKHPCNVNLKCLYLRYILISKKLNSVSLMKTYVSNWSVRHSNYPNNPLFSETNVVSTRVASSIVVVIRWQLMRFHNQSLACGKFFVIKSERKST